MLIIRRQVIIDTMAINVAVDLQPEDVRSRVVADGINNVLGNVDFVEVEVGIEDTLPRRIDPLGQRSTVWGNDLAEAAANGGDVRRLLLGRIIVRDQSIGSKPIFSLCVRGEEDKGAALDGQYMRCHTTGLDGIVEGSLSDWWEQHWPRCDMYLLTLSICMIFQQRLQMLKTLQTANTADRCLDHVGSTVSRLGGNEIQPRNTTSIREQKRKENLPHLQRPRARN